MKKIPLYGSLSVLPDDYVFARTAKRKKEYMLAHPEAEIIDLGIGDVTGPLPRSAATELSKAVLEQSEKASFRGYGPYEGYEFCRKAVSDYYFRRTGVKVSEGDIFIGDGAKSAIMRLMLMFESEIVVFSPAYPAYADCAAALGKKVKTVTRSAQGDFQPRPDSLALKPYLVILCSPDNPTGTAIKREVMRDWFEFCRKSGSAILFDAAYENFCAEEGVFSAYMQDGMKDYAVEIGSLSKSACFTGLRGGWTVIPSEIADGRLKKAYERMLAATYNGCPYVVQRAMSGALSKDGDFERSAIKNEMRSAAKILSLALASVGFGVTNSDNSPYIWAEKPKKLNGVESFGYFIGNLGIAITPGEGFGKEWSGFIRLSVLGGEKAATAAARRILAHFKE